MNAKHIVSQVKAFFVKKPVGPRAYIADELSEMESFAPIILRVNPGITGWWQIFGRHNTTFKKRLQMDEYYISNWSLWLDAYIIIKTIGVVLRGTGMRLGNRQI